MISTITNIIVASIYSVLCFWLKSPAYVAFMLFVVSFLGLEIIDAIRGRR